MQEPTLTFTLEIRNSIAIGSHNSHASLSLKTMPQQPVAKFHPALSIVDFFTQSFLL
jgi:hypothetical protein